MSGGRTMAKRQIIFASAKGGVGKSYGSRTFLDAARRAGRTVSAWDLDGATGSLGSLYPDRDPEVGVGTEDVRDRRAQGAWLDALYTSADDVLLDVPGGALDDLTRVLDGGGPSLVAEARNAGRELVVVSVIGIKRDATGTPQDAIGRFGSTVHHVVLKNGYFGEEGDFIIFDGIPAPTPDDSTARRYGKSGAAIREVGGEVVYLPRLNPITDALLDVEKLTFVQGIEALAVLGRRHTSNVRVWLAAAEAALAGSWLAPNGEIPYASLKPTRARATAAVG
jgi:hypothetical protein